MIQSIRKYEIIAFMTGFALLAYELAAARLLAPGIGSSMYVWTSVIGVIIAALSAGYGIGGVIADRRVTPQDVAWLLIGSATTILLTLICADSTLAILQGVPDLRLQGLLASLVLFSPTSFVLGMISPYLARLRTPSVTQTGRSIASLSALNAIGGIAGTFCVGFILFGFIGTKETMLFIGGLLMATSWLIEPQSNKGKRLVLTIWLAVIAALLWIPTPKGIVAIINTPASHYQIWNSEINGDPVRLLSTGPTGVQSGTYIHKPGELVFDYTRAMADVAEQAPHKQSILILGGGAFTLPAYLADAYPNSRIDVVEIDPQLPDIAKDYFGYYHRPNITIHSQDARAYLNTNSKKYDLIFVDVYADTSIPFALTTQQYAQRLHASLAYNGAVIVNIIGADTPNCQPLLAAVHGSYLHEFDSHKFMPLHDPQLQRVQNIIFVYGQAVIDWLEAEEYKRPPAIPLTDNFAPVERLQQQCGMR